MNRAYSLLEIKEMDDDARTITGIASTPTPDRMADVVMPEGAVFTLPIPLLWQHNSSQPIGHVTEAKVTKKGIEIVATIAKDVSEEIDRAWKLIKAGLVRGLSIGFRGLDTEQIPNSWGVVFEKWEWLELSAVTIPANAEATITSVKKFDINVPAATGPRGEGGDAPPGVTGKSTSTVKSLPKEGKTMKTIAEQIAAFEATRAAKAAELETVMTTTEGETLDVEAAEVADALGAEIKSIDDHLKRLRLVESLKASTAKPVQDVRKPEDGAQARAGVVVKQAAKLDPGIRFARIAKCIGLAKGNMMHAEQIAVQRYGNDDVVVNTIKAAVAAGTTSDSTWAGALVGDETSAFADFVEFLRPQTILGRFGANGVPSLRRVPFRTALVGQTSGGDGYWVGEGNSKPLTKFDFTRSTLEPLKVANIAVLTMELLRDSSPSAEMLVRDSLAAALRERLDTDFIDPAKAVAAGVSPASITNGVTPVVASGTGTADNIRTDIKALFAQFIAANNAPTSGAWIMSATTALSLSLMLNPLGQREFPGISMNGGTFEGLPVIVSEYVPTVSAGTYVFLVNAQDVYLADEGGINIDMSREASLQMDDAPTNASDTPTATSLVSMFQTNSVAFLAERTINWKKRRAEAVAVLSGVNWGD